ncbi:MAG: hypothetical protein ACP5E2_16105, partial [Terracidiphilus sp.]
PWFKFWSADYLTDAAVDKLPLEVQALLVRMWCALNLHGSLPDDPVEVARLTLAPVDARAASGNGQNSTLRRLHRS